MAFHILGSEQRKGLSLPGTFGQVSTPTCEDGHDPAFNDSVPRSPLSSFPTPDARLHVIHIDLVGPLPPSQGFTYLLTCVDRFTRWLEGIPITGITAELVAQAFLNGWIARFGIPFNIITDRGRQFKSKLWNAKTCLHNRLLPTVQWHG